MHEKLTLGAVLATIPNDLRLAAAGEPEPVSEWWSERHAMIQGNCSLADYVQHWRTERYGASNAGEMDLSAASPAELEAFNSIELKARRELAAAKRVDPSSLPLAQGM